MAEYQYQHHCMMYFEDVTCRIVRMNGPLLQVCMTDEAGVPVMFDGGLMAFTTLDLSNVNFEAYCKAAVLNDYENAQISARYLN